MLSAICSKWWIFLLNGVASILFGIMAFVWPGITILTLVLLFGIYCLADGFTAIWASFVKNDTGRSWWQMLLIGLVSIGAGIMAIAWPGISVAALLLVIAAWAIVRGVFEIVAAIELRKVIDNEWWLILAGLASIFFGIALVAQPAIGAVVMAWWIGAFACVRGLLMLALAFKLRKIVPAMIAAKHFAASH
jgi:uncharacterized membrane protein HdeD (DUF308 family)